MQLTWFGYAYIILTVLGVFVTIAQIDRPRGPVTSSEAISRLIASGLIIWGMVAVGFVH